MKIYNDISNIYLKLSEARRAVKVFLLGIQNENETAIGGMIWRVNWESCTSRKKIEDKKILIPTLPATVAIFPKFVDIKHWTVDMSMNCE